MNKKMTIQIECNVRLFRFSLKILSNNVKNVYFVYFDSS